MQARNKRRFVAGALASLLLALAACGGDEGSNSDNGDGGGEEFVSAADAICTDTASQGVDIFRRHVPSSCLRVMRQPPPTRSSRALPRTIPT